MDELALEALRERVRRLVQREAPEAEIAPPELGGLRMVAPRGADGLLSAGYEPKVVAALRRLTRPGDVCADLGANVGYFTLLLAQLVGPCGRVVAFEPRDDMAAYLERNVALNGAHLQVELRRVAIGDGTVADVELHSGGVGSEMRSTILPGLAEREARTGRRVISVPAIALDACFGPGERLDVVKMDIEGAEAIAPIGARRIMAEQRPVFVVEFHAKVGWPAIGNFAASGYRFERCDGTPIEAPTSPDAVPGHFVAVPA